VENLRCSACVDGKFVNPEKLDECSLCTVDSSGSPSNHFIPDSERMMFVKSTCVVCNGRSSYLILPSSGRVNSTNCRKCPPGTFGNSIAVPLTFTYGSIQYEEIYSTFQDRCVSCDAGKYQIDSTETGCVPCEPGTIASQPMQHQCQPCSADTFANRDATACDACAIGKYSPPRTLFEQCVPCDMTGQGCKDCAYDETLADKRVCVMCEIGYELSTAESSIPQCTQCSAGYYGIRDLSGSAICLSCGPGKFTAVLGTTICANCSAGSYNSATGATQCASCSAGVYSQRIGGTACGVCAVSTYSLIKTQPNSGN